MRKLALLVSALVLLVMSVLPAAAQDETIVDIAAGNEDFSILVQAVTAAGLVDTLAGEGPFTVFAPTNDAFLAAIAALNLDPAALLTDVDLLSSILLYHVANGELTSDTLVDGAEVVTVQGETIEVAIGDAVVLNGTTTVVTADIQASNGVIHVIDNVLLPPTVAEALAGDGEEAAEEEEEAAEEEEMAAGTIVDLALADETFATLVAAVDAADLVETLASEGPFTVFAPTNEAFAAALEALGLTAEELLADTDTLTTVLLYHVVAGNVTSSDIVDGAEVETVQGETILTEIVDGGVVLNGAVNVIAADITASNGVIHVIDGVLLPPSLVEALSAPAEEPQQEAAEEEAPAEETAEEPAEQFTGQTFLRLAHLAGDIGGADIYINGQLRRPFTDVQQGTVTGFFALPEGNYRIQVVPTGRNTGRAVIDAELFLGDGEYNTVAAYGNAFSTGIDAAVIPEDRESTLSATGARVTVFHAIPDAPAVDILANGNLIAGRIAYPGTLTLVGGGTNDGAFTFDVPAGTYDLAVVPNGQTSPVVIDLSGTTLEAGNYYFVAAYGTLADPQVALGVAD